MHQYNFHTHSSFDDGKNKPEDYVIEAIRQGIKAFGFSGHAPLPFPTDWCIQSEDLEEYLSEIQLLKIKYESRLEIFSGLEADFIEGIICPNQVKAKYNLDYIIGAVHFLKKENEIFEIDGSFENFEEGFVKHFQSNAKALVVNFTENSLEMVKNHTPDILGHFDKIKLYLSRFLPDLEAQPWYIECMTEIVKAAKEKQLIVEINTRGIYKRYSSEPYPSYKLLKTIYENGIRVCLNSDAHLPSEITSAYKKVISEIKQIGFSHLWVFSNNKWQPIEIN